MAIGETQQKMNILACSVLFKPKFGGVEEFTHSVCLVLSEQGHRICLVTTKWDGGAEFDRKNTQFEIYRVDKKRCPYYFLSWKNIIIKFHVSIKYFYSLWLMYKEMKRLVKKRKIEKTLCFFWDICGLAAYFVNRKMGIPYYVVAHGDDILEKGQGNLLLKAMQKLVFAHAEAIFVVSEYTEKRLLKNYPNIPSVYITYCGVDPKKFFRTEPEKSLAERYNLRGKKVLLSICRLLKHKGIDYAIRAFGEYIKKYPQTNAVYLIGGKERFKKELEKLVDTLGLNGKVIFLGPIKYEERNDYYNLSDVFIMPSRQWPGSATEGFPLVFLEANSCERPVIGGNSGGVPSAIQDKYNGLLVNPWDTSDICEKIKILFNDEAYARKLGTQGRKRAQANFTWEKVTQRLCSVLEKK